METPTSGPTRPRGRSADLVANSPGLTRSPSPEEEDDEIPQNLPFYSHDGSDEDSVEPDDSVETGVEYGAFCSKMGFKGVREDGRRLRRKKFVLTNPFWNMSLFQWFKLLWMMGDSLFDGVDVADGAYIQLVVNLVLVTLSAVFVTILELSECILFWWPLRIFRILTGRGANILHQVNHRPVFIIGHYRSGTTLFHNLFTLDKENFTYTSGTQVVFANSFLFHSVLVYLYRAIGCIPKKRPFDEVKLTMSKPQEDEVAVAVLSGGVSPFTQFFLMQERQRRCFAKFLTFKGCLDGPVNARRRTTLTVTDVQNHAPLDTLESAPSATVSVDQMDTRTPAELMSRGPGKQWRDAFVTFLWKTAFVSGTERRPVLKSPAHTSRIPLLLELFPDAQFVFVHRHPFDVWRSTVNMLKKTNDLMGLGPVPTAEEMFGLVTEQYSCLMREYMRTRHLVPEGNLVEVRYSDLVEDPTKMIVNTFKKLGIKSKPPLEALQAFEGKSHDNFQRNKFSDLPEEIKTHLRTSLNDIFEEFGYE